MKCGLAPGGWMPFFLLCLWLLSWSSNAAVPNSEEVKTAINLKIEKYTLSNGLTVLLHEDHSAPFFNFQQWFRVGSKYEKPGLTGLAHFFEHLMFKGTTKYPGGVFDRLIRANGGVSNAFTTQDFTAYYMELPPERLELAVSFESDRMRNLLFDPKEIDSEREVVKEERRFRVDNEVSGTIDERLWRTVFKVHPYRWPVIGSMVDLNRASIQDMKDFYRVYYAPNNAVVTVVGDFDPAVAKKLINKYYGSIKPQPIPPYQPPVEPEQVGERRTVVHRDVQNISMAVAYKSVKSSVPEMYSLDLAANILGGGSSSRLFRRLVYQAQSVSSVSVSSYTPGDPGMFRIQMSLKPGQKTEPVLQAVAAEIYKMRTQPVTDEELNKAKNSVMKDYVEAFKSISGKANALAIHELYSGDFKSIYSDLEKYTLVTKEQILSVADKYLKPTARSVVIVEPGVDEAKAGDENTGDEKGTP
jgi:zinc protease